MVDCLVATKDMMLVEMKVEMKDAWLVVMLDHY